MSPIVKAGIAGAAGSFLADYIEPQLLKLAKPDTDFAKKATRGAAVGAGAGVVYWALGKVG